MINTITKYRHTDVNLFFHGRHDTLEGTMQSELGHIVHDPTTPIKKNGPKNEDTQMQDDSLKS